jgi:heptaprenyl diphosphate synthase
VLLFALYMLGTRDAIALMLAKVVLSGLLFGGPSAMAFSLAGGVLSLLGMMLAKRMKGIGLLAVSVIGAVLHNVGQVLVAMAILQTTGLLYYLAVLTLVAVGTGALTGVVAGMVSRTLKRNGAWS